MMPPSMIGLAWFTRARPRMTTPPQSPARRLPGASALVKMIGLSHVPSAMMVAPGLMIRVAAGTPWMTVPAGMVRVRPAST